MYYRSKAPLRLGLAGGGTDVEPYSELYGGAILNATINLFAYATIELTNSNKIELVSIDMGEKEEFDVVDFLEVDDKLSLLKGVYNHISKKYMDKPVSFRLTTYVDAPPGSGLGTSSTLVTAIVGAFTEWLKLPLGEYDIAHMAYVVEREELGLLGGKQDQYAATFGGFNYMEFLKGQNVVVNPLRIKNEYLNELAFNLVLYYTGTSRQSSNIIEVQKSNVENNKVDEINAMHKLKEQSQLMKEALLKGELNKIGEILDFGWEHKKKMANCISNPIIDEIYYAAKKAGALGGKISGAGGGGFMMFYCPVNSRYRVINALEKFGGEFRRFAFTKNGLQSWTL